MYVFHFTNILRTRGVLDPVKEYILKYMNSKHKLYNVHVFDNHEFNIEPKRKSETRR